MNVDAVPLMTRESFSPSVAEMAESDGVAVEVQLRCVMVHPVSVVVVVDEEEGDTRMMGVLNSVAVVVSEGVTVTDERVSVPFTFRNNGHLIFDEVSREMAMLSNLTSPPLIVNKP